MGIFDRLGTLLKSNINDLISRAEKPEKVLNQLITDMRSQLAKAKQEVAGAIADEKKLHAQVEKEKTQADEWQRRAMLGVEQGRDDLAKQALLRHNEHLQAAQTLHENWVRQKAESESLKSSLRTLNDKIEEAKRKKNLLIARQKRADAQHRIQKTMSSMSDTSAFEHFERMATKIEEAERKQLAAAELTEELTGDNLSEEFAALEYDGGADQQLLELKKQMGMLGSGAGGERLQLTDGEDDDIQDADIVKEEGQG